MKIEKTNAARLLDRAGIGYELVPYTVDEEHLAATHVAEQLGEPIECVFKTLVLRGDRTGLFVCVVPGDHEVDLKAAARVSGNKKADLIPMKELLTSTGYVRGGCSPVGMKKIAAHVFPLHGGRPSLHLCQRRCPGPSAQGCAAGAGRFRGRRACRTEPSAIAYLPYI